MNNKDQMKVDIQGEVEIIVAGESTVYKNAITLDAISIILNCLPGIPNSHRVDTVRFIGDFGQVDKSISDSEVDFSEDTESANYHSVLFITQAIDSDFEGTIEEINLRCSTLDKSFSIKTGLNIPKPNNVNIEIRWRIRIN